MNKISRVLKSFSNLFALLSKSINFKGSVGKYIDSYETIYSLLDVYKPKYLCDIGANNGSWMSVMIRMNPYLKGVVMFEPQKKFFNELQSLRLSGVKKRIFNFGLGNRNEVGYIKGGTASASYFNANKIQNEYFPNSFMETKQESVLRRLDDVYHEENLHKPDLIKIDVQGYELNVLKGAVKTLSTAKFLIIELSFKKFYEKQPDLWKVLKFLEDNNYIMISNGYELWSESKPKELLQMDGIFKNIKN